MRDLCLKMNLKIQLPFSQSPFFGPLSSFRLNSFRRAMFRQKFFLRGASIQNEPIVAHHPSNVYLPARREGILDHE
jgi:hypothetical protein